MQFPNRACSRRFSTRLSGGWASVVGAVFLGLLVLTPDSARASFPVVTTSKPLGAVRGEEATLTFSGTRLGDAYTAISDHPGIEIIKVTPIDGSKTQITFRSAADLAPGLYPIRLVTRTGVANIRLVGIGVLPIVDETEPNNSIESAQSIQMDQTIDGVITNEDVDWFKVSLKSGERLNVEIEGMRLTYDLRNRLFDPILTVVDEAGNELTQCDDSMLLGQDAVCSWLADQEGDYWIGVRDTLYGGAAHHGYRLHVGRFPRPLAVIPKTQSSDPSSGTLDVTVHSMDGSQQSLTMKIPSVVGSQTVPLSVENEHGIAPSPNWTRLSPLPMQYEIEPNDNPAKAPLFSVPSAFCGVIEQDDVFDCFGFECKKGESLRVEVFARNPSRSPIDSVCHVFDPAGKVIKGADDVGVNKDSSLEFTAAQGGRYVVRVYDQQQRCGPTYQYRIEVQRRVPSFHLTLKELRQSEAGFASIPAGGRGAVMAQVTRKSFGGEIEISTQGLPPGVDVKAFPIPAGRGEIPVLFTAKSEQEPCVSLFQLSGQGQDGQNAVAGTFGQQHKLVLGQNRRQLWGFSTQTAAAAVTQKAPFQIELVQPKTQVVRQGSKPLKVKITRDAGFEEPVRIRSLYGPPGIRTNNSLQIKKGETELEIPLTAAGNAALGTWPIILLANYKAANGNRDLATNAIDLNVEKEWFSFEFPRVTAQQGATAEVEIPIKIDRPYLGTATIQLAGLPRGVTSSDPKQPITPESKVARFLINIAADAKPGSHKTLVCIGRIVVGDETIVQTTGRGELRILPSAKVKQANDWATKKNPQPVKGSP